MRTRLFRGLLLLGTIWLFAPGAPAQAPGDVRETLPQPSPPPTRPAPAPEVETPAAPAAPEVPAGPAVEVERFEITGNTVVSSAVLRQLVAPYEGRRLTLLQIYEVADRLTRHYREQGYALSTVTVPPQEVASGTVKLEVIEGEVGQILVENNRSYSQSFILARLDRLAPGQIVDLDRVRRQMARLNELPGLNARAVVRPGAEFGSSDIVVKANEQRLQTNARLNNHGRETIGEWRIEGDFIVNNPARIGDRLDLAVVHAEDGRLNYGRINYSVPVNRMNTRVNAYYSRYRYDVDTWRLGLGPGFPGDLEGEGDDYGIGVTHPLWRTDTWNLFGNATVNRTVTKQSGALVPLRQDRTEDLTLLLLTLFGNYIHANAAVTGGSVSLSTNFQSNDDGNQNNAQQAKLRVDASHLHPFNDYWSLLLRGSGVVSSDPLLNIERFRIGGPDDVRSYPSAELAGDQGVFASAQLQRRFVVEGFFTGQLRTYLDGGVVHRKNPLPLEQKTESLTGIGGGLSLFLGPHITLDFDVSHNLGARSPSDGRDTRFWLGLAAYY